MSVYNYCYTDLFRSNIIASIPKRSSWVRCQQLHTNFKTFSILMLAWMVMSIEGCHWSIETIVKSVSFDYNKSDSGDKINIFPILNVQNLTFVLSPYIKEHKYVSKKNKIDTYSVL